MNKLLESYGILILNANPQYDNYIYHLELKKNKTFRLIKGSCNHIYYDSYGNYNIDDINNMLILEFTELELDFHNIKKTNVKQLLKYDIIDEEKLYENNKPFKSNKTIVFDKCPNPFEFETKIVNNENIFYCNLEYINKSI